jgi:hypothetical protein
MVFAPSITSVKDKSKTFNISIGKGSSASSSSSGPSVSLPSLNTGYSGGSSFGSNMGSFLGSLGAARARGTSTYSSNVQNEASKIIPEEEEETMKEAASQNQNNSDSASSLQNSANNVVSNEWIDDDGEWENWANQIPKVKDTPARPTEMKEKTSKALAFLDKLQT